LGIRASEHEVISGLLLSHRQVGQWESIAQETLADRLGISRSTVNHRIANIRRKGLIAVSPDEPRRPRPHWDAPLRYCLDPYVFALGLCAARRASLVNLAQRLYREADERFDHFLGEVRLGRWEWRLGDLVATSEQTLVEVSLLFRDRHPVDLLRAEPSSRV
jgi:DNA-binding transcriptional MocR family regulator